MAKRSTTQEITAERYQELFSGDKRNKAHAQALDIRKFEIDLYWKRATYFWTFIGATMAGFLLIQNSSSPNKQDLAIILACLGLVFSFAWFCVNRGSKFWQENWEKHVDILEDHVTGPLYKTVISRNNDATLSDKARSIVTGPSNISVSKVNQIISLYVSVLWLVLLIYSLPTFNINASFNWFYVILISISGLACTSFLWLGRSYSGGYYHIANLRSSRIRPTANK